MHRAAVAALAFAVFALPTAADARSTVRVSGTRVSFFADTLALVARDRAEVRLSDGTVVRGDAAYVDLRADRAVIAGAAVVRSRGGVERAADAVAIDLEGPSLTLLDASTGTRTTDRRLIDERPGASDAQTFAFPETDDAYAYIRGRRADVTLRANVRMTPAVFPTSVGALPVPTYLYAFSPSAGFASTALSGATFDQPYNLTGSATALTALHARWIDGPGASVALQQHLLDGDRGYAIGALETPLRAASTASLTAYRRTGPATTLSLDATGSAGIAYAHAAATAALGRGGARLDYARTSTQYSTLDLALRTPDAPIGGGVTLRLTAHAGFDAQTGGLYRVLPDRARFATVWRTGIDAFLATPVVRLPFATTFAGTLDLARTYHAYPHVIDGLVATGQLSRTFSRRWSAFAGYDARYTHDVYPNAQALFFPPQIPVAPDGTPYTGYLAYSGASMSRAAHVEAQWTPDATTSVRLSLRRTNDFPQFDGYGRPRTELRADARFRPAPNIGITLGRAYDFGWGGTRWVPRWTFAVTP